MTVSLEGASPPAASRRSRIRLYAAPAGQPRVRRATDVLLLLGALIGLWLLVAGYPPSAFERSFEDFLANVPGWLDPVWGVAYDFLWLWAMLLVLAAVVCRRWVVALQAVGSLVLGVVVALIVSRLAIGSWPDVWHAIEGASDGPLFPAMRVAETAAVIIVISPHLVAPLRTTGRWILFFGVVGALFEAHATPGGIIAGYLVAWTAAAAVRLATGTSAGRPALEDVAAALGELGIDAEGLRPSDRSADGVVVFTGTEASGTPLLVKIFGRDAYDNRLLAKVWRSVAYRETGAELGLSRLQAAEHEALMTVLAERAGVHSREVVTATQVATGDAVLVLRGDAKPIGELSADELDDRLLLDCWDTVIGLGRADIAHLQLDQSTIAVHDGEVWLLDFGGATPSPSRNQLQTDHVQLLAATAAVVGGERATAAAVEALGTEGVGALLPYLQSAALATPLRKSIRAAGISVDQLRKDMAAAAGVEEPDLFKLRRLTWWVVIQAALLFLAASAVFQAATSVDWTQVREDLSNASWGWIVFGFFLAQTPRLAQAVSTLGSVAARLPFWPVYIKELATCYLNLAMPSSVARMAMSIRFFQCAGLPGVTAVTSGAIDSLANNVIQVAILVVLLIFGESTVDLNLSAPSSDSGQGTLLWILVGLVVVVVLVVLIVPKIRNAVFGRLRKWWPEVRDAITGLRGAGKLRLLIFGNLGAELLFSAALAVFARSLGYHIPYGEILVINESVALLSSFIPVPGGIGVVEFGLSVGLTSAGMTQESAVVAVLLYRLSTFYLPPIWGFFALRWLQKNRYL